MGPCIQPARQCRATAKAQLSPWLVQQPGDGVRSEGAAPARVWLRFTARAMPGYSGTCRGWPKKQNNTGSHFCLTLAAFKGLRSASHKSKCPKTKCIAQRLRSLDPLSPPPPATRFSLAARALLHTAERVILAVCGVPGDDSIPEGPAEGGVLGGPATTPLTEVQRRVHPPAPGTTAPPGTGSTSKGSLQVKLP